MAKKLQLRRGTTAQHSSFTGDVGECTVDTDKDTLVVHDNSTAGGFPLARENLSNVSSATIVGNIDDDAITYAKMQDIATANRVLGSASAGAIQEVLVATDMIADDAVTYGKIQDISTANRVLGKASAGTVEEVQVATDMVADDAITYAKMQDLSTANRVLGGTAAGAISEVQVVAEMIADSAVTEPKLATAAAGSAGQFLQKTASGMDWATVSTQAFPTGTLMLFQQSSAPTGWTKQTTHNDKALRVVSGSTSSGGATAFSSIFGGSVSTGAHTLSTSEMPSHTHGYPVIAGNIFGGGNPYSLGIIHSSGGITLYGNSSTYFSPTQTTTQSAGSGGSHSHTMSMDLQFVDLIIASHN